MSIAPIVRSVTVKAPPARAFEVFARHIGQWWPRGGGIGEQPCVDVIIEPREGGRWYERDAAGTETQWGKVIAWDPPGRLLLAWQIDPQWDYDPELLTEVELTFAPAEGGGTVVTLEHRHLERFGRDAATHADRLGNGWPVRLGLYTDFANHNLEEVR